MQFKEGTHVISSDGHDVGTIDRVVLDPSTNEVTGLIVRKGWLFTEDRVVPISLVDAATEERVTLHQSNAALKSLPQFEETYYVPANENDYRDGNVFPPAPYANSLYGYPPVGTTWWGYPGYLGAPAANLEPTVAERVQQNIPRGTVAVREGARVVSQDGDHVGNVEEVFTDSTSQRATHLVISQGLLFKERKLIPTNWVRDEGEDEIMLTVSTDVVNRLPEYRHEMQGTPGTA